MTQLDLVGRVDLIRERAKQREERDVALDALESARGELITAATAIARSIARERGQVTSSDVLREMRSRGYQLDGYDPRWLGAVFRTGKGWRRVGYVPDGSHHRPISVWAEALP